MSVQTRSLTNSELLVQSVFELAATRGVTALSSRRIAEHVGVSPSAINYCFGNQAALLHHARKVDDDMRAQFWKQKARILSDLTLSPSDFGPELFSMQREAIASHPAGEALFWADAIDSYRQAKPIKYSAATNAERSFLANLIEACGISKLGEKTLQSFCLGIRFGYRVHKNPVRFDPWALSLVTQFAVRAAGRAPDAEIDCGRRQLAETEAMRVRSVDVSPHQTAQRIIRTAIEIVLQAGPVSVTHRAVANRAGLSVSSVQHFFKDRQFLLNAVFQKMHEDARDTAIPDPLDERTLTTKDLIDRIGFDKIGSDSMEVRRLGTIFAIMLSAADNATTRRIAEGLLAQMGQSSQSVLRALKNPRGAIGRLDAQIFSFIGWQSAVIALTETNGASNPEPALRTEIIENLLVSLFE